MGINPDTLYVVEMDNGDTMYAVTPDGEGMYWYETQDEAEETALPDHHKLAFVTEGKLDQMRGWA